MTMIAGRLPIHIGSAELNNGDQMTQAEFHRLYEMTPDGFRAELIGGIVYVASPLRLRHGTNHLPLGSLFLLYEGSTPGVQSGDNTTIILGEDCEPQPDLMLRILPRRGGQTAMTKDDYITGAPELVAEISNTSKAIDLHAKKEDYEKYGVIEYLVVSLGEEKLRWFDLAAGKELSPDADGIYRIRTFPGLWIHGESLFTRDIRRLVDTLQQGLATPEHREFAASLRSPLRSRKSSRKRAR